MHHVFAYAPGVRNSVGRLGAGLDVRGDGGYVVVEPSTVEEDERNGTYTWDRLAKPFDQPLSPMPEWLLERVESAGAATAARATNGATPDRPSTDFIPEGQRNDTLFRRACAMRRAGFGVEAILAALQDMNERQCRPPLDNHELERIAQQAAGYAPAARGLIIRVDGNSEPLPGELPLSDAGNAGRMVLLYPDRFRWVAEEKVWLYWDDTRWARDKLFEVQRLAIETARTIQRAALTLSGDAKARVFASRAWTTASSGGSG